MAGFQAPDTGAFTAALADGQLNQRVRTLVSKAVAEYEYIMEWGSAQERAALLRSALPGLMRAMATKDQQDADAEMRRSYAELRQAFQSHIAENTPT